MRFNQKELAYIAMKDDVPFDKEGILWLKEKEGYFWSKNEGTTNESLWRCFSLSQLRFCKEMTLRFPVLEVSHLNLLLPSSFIMFTLYCMMF